MFYEIIEGKVINILFFFMFLVANITAHQIVKENLDIEKELELINKAPVKSIHVSHTPAFKIKLEKVV